MDNTAVIVVLNKAKEDIGKIESDLGWTDNSKEALRNIDAAISALSAIQSAEPYAWATVPRLGAAPITTAYPAVANEWRASGSTVIDLFTSPLPQAAQPEQAAQVKENAASLTSDGVTVKEVAGVSDYTDEQLEAGILALQCVRKALGENASDESFCGAIYDAMRAAAPAAPSVASERDAVDAARLIPKWAGEFKTFSQWVIHAQHTLASPSHRPAVCIDAIGRRCSIGKDFMTARDEGTFPIRYFWEFETVAADGDKEIAELREVVIEAADEWSGYVEVDTAPRRCSEHIALAFDAAIAAIEKEKP